MSNPKTVIIFLDTDKHASPFDMLTACDLYPDAQILYYSDVDPKNAKKIAQDAIFPRGPDGVKKTKIFIGGYDVDKADKILQAVKEAMFPPFEMGIIVDPRGAHTTGSAAVAKTLRLAVEKGLGGFEGKNVTILAATGPVGQIAANIYATEGANVIVTSRTQEKAEALAKKVNDETSSNRVKGVKAETQEEVGQAISESEIILAAGAAGVELLKLETLKSYGGKCKIVADINAVPPLGVEGLKAEKEGVEVLPGVFGVGALAIGSFKNIIEAQVFKRAVDLTRGTFDYRTAYETAKLLALSDISKPATAGKVKFGIEFVPDKAPEKIVKLVVAAEKGGFDHVWITDHYNNRNVYVFLTDIALNTQKIRIGTGVTNPFHVSPVWTAAAVATLDELSKNRMILGLGPGDLTTMKSLGIEHKKPLTAVRESVDIIRRLWRRETVKFDGQVMKVEGARLNFKVKKPIPIYVGAQGPKMLELAGATADGILINAAHPRDFEYARMQIEKGAKAAGRDLSEIDIAAYACCSVDYDVKKAKKKAREVVAFIVAGSPDEVLKRHGIPVEEKNRINESLAKGDFGVFKTVTDQMLEAFSICGTPSEVVNKINELLKVGVTQVVIGSPIGPKKADSIYLVAEEVIPRFT